VVTGWPGGKDEMISAEEELAYYNKKVSKPKNILIFSPHPDDDVFFMGSTIGKLVK
jgi:glucosamine-6-phosphate deaminase